MNMRFFIRNKNGVASSRCRNANGNVLLIILAGILLSALLAETVMSFLDDSREVTEDRARVLVTQLDDEETEIKNAYNMLRFANNCSVEEINFSPIADAAYNTNSPESGRCSIYHENGGGISQVKIPVEARKNLTAAYEEFWQEHAGIQVVDLGNDTSTSPPCDGCEISLVLYNLTDDVCRQMNFNRTGVRTIYGTESGAEFADADFDGTFSARDQWLGSGDDPALPGQRAFCLKESGGAQRNIYVSILEVR
tara:strand:+ start:4293 stop:5048 length:756 start_codon:yes stop_codon:yes gene_type:complete